MKFQIIPGVVVIIASIFLIIYLIGYQRIVENGKIVPMSVKKVPEFHPRQKVKFTILQYEEKNYYLKLSAGLYWSHQQGDILPVKMVSGTSDVVEPDETTKGIFWAYLFSSLIGLAGVFLIINAFTEWLT